MSTWSAGGIRHRFPKGRWKTTWKSGKPHRDDGENRSGKEVLPLNHVVAVEGIDTHRQGLEGVGGNQAGNRAAPCGKLCGRCG